MAQDTQLNQNRSKSREQLLADLDERLRLNRGQFTTLASDTGSNVPFLLRQGRERVQDPTGLGYQNPQLNFEIPQAPSTYQIPENPTYPDQTFSDQQLPENVDPYTMLEAIFSAAWEPQLPTTDQLETLYQRTGQTYPIQSLANGGVLYNDGSVSQNSGQNPMPIATMNNGTILWSDGFVRERPPEGLSGYLAGVAGLSQLLFGKQQQVTQGFGNYNPSIEPGSGYNMGTDFRTRDLQSRQLNAPVPMRVVQVLRDDGTQWGDQSGHMGYGNSVLVELPSGEMIRLSHLSQMGKFQVGDVLNPGDFIGIPGTTGNTNGEHLDVEYYNQQGQIDNPNNFKMNVAQYNMGNQIVGVSPYGEPVSSQQPQQPQQPQQSVNQDRLPTPANDLLDSGINAVKSGIDTVSQVPQQVNKALQPGSQTRQVAGQIPEKAAQTAGFNTELGVGEAIRGEDPMQARISALGRQEYNYNPYRQLAGNITERIGDTLGIPEGVFSEAIAGGPTKRTGQALAAEIGQETPQQVPGIRQNIFDIGKDLASKADPVRNLVESATGRVSSAVNQAGEGVKGLGQAAVSGAANIFQKTPLAKVGPKSVVGEDSTGGDQSAINKSSLVNTKNFTPANDIRDEFFKSGKDQAYKDYIRPESIGDGGLSLDLFNDQFYQNPSNIADVFGQTYLGKQASDKFRDYFRAKYSGKDFNQQDVNDIVGTIPSVIQGGFSLREPGRVEEEKPSLQDYLNQGKTAAQWYAETGQQATLDKIRSNPRLNFNERSGDIREIGVDPNPGTTTGGFNNQMTIDPRAAVRASIQAAGQGKKLISPSGNIIYNYTPANANMSDASTGLPVVGRNTPDRTKANIFTRSKSSIKNIFGR